MWEWSITQALESTSKIRKKKKKIITFSITKTKSIKSPEKYQKQIYLLIFKEKKREVISEISWN